MFSRLPYWHRILKAYLLSNISQLSFWHGKPEINNLLDLNNVWPYYMKFHYKADYRGHFDKQGIPMLNYHGKIGLQYNPIAISQYGLGNYNLYIDTKEYSRLKNFINISDWLVENLTANKHGVQVWHHHFDFEYRSLLKSPWYSGLAQGLGISVLLRAYKETKKKKYLDAYYQAWPSMIKKIDEGGVVYIDDDGDYWIEEYIVNPPTHILNGFIWALFGVYDSWKYLNNKSAEKLFHGCIATLIKNINKYDTGYWSLYEQSGTLLPMVASPFYHQLHMVQLIILYNLSGKIIFKEYADKWNWYNNRSFYRKRALMQKILFKVLYY